MQGEEVRGLTAPATAEELHCETRSLEPLDPLREHRAIRHGELPSFRA